MTFRGRLLLAAGSGVAAASEFVGALTDRDPSAFTWVAAGLFTVTAAAHGWIAFHSDRNAPGRGPAG